jgi:hypothetical protein
MLVQYMGSNNLNCVVMVQNDLLVSVRMVAYGVVWCGMACCGVDWSDWMTARVCSGGLLKRGCGGAVWDGLEWTSERVGDQVESGVWHDGHGRVRGEQGVRQGGKEGRR